MCYFHIGDLIHEHKTIRSREEYEVYYKEKGTLKACYSRYLKSNLGKKNAFQKLMRLIDEVEFVNLQQSDESIGWKDVSVVKL